MNKSKLDIPTLIGLVVGFGGMGIGYYLEGGDFSALLAISPILIIFGGTFGAVIITMTDKDIKRLPNLIKQIFQDKIYNYEQTINDLCNWAYIARSEGFVALGDVAENINEPFTKRGVEYILEGNDHDRIKNLMEAEVEAMIDRHERGAKPFEQGGGYAPTMGIIGAVLGLVVVLGGLGSSGVDELGHGIATAFLATLMGIGLANLVLLPFAEKLKSKSDEEVLYRSIIIEGVLGIQTGQNPTTLRRILVAYLPEDEKHLGLNRGKDANKVSDEDTSSDKGSDE